MNDLTIKEKRQAYYLANKDKYRERYEKYRAARKADPKKHAEHNTKAREYRRLKMLDPEYRAKRNEYKRQHQKAQLRAAKEQDPAKAEEIRAKRRAAHKRWIDGMRSSDPERFARYKKTQLDYDRRNQWQRSRRAKCPEVRLAQAIRNTINCALRGRYKAATTIELIGCTQEQLMRHLESQFDQTMTWELYGHGIGKWTVDYIRPLASYNLAIGEEQRKAFHFTNLKPMWFEENCAKSSRHNGEKCFHSVPR